MRPSDLLRTGLLTTLAAAASSAPAQDPVLDRQVVASTGDEAIGTGIALEFTLGDLVVYTDLGTQGAPFTQGFHQLTDDPTGTAEMASSISSACSCAWRLLEPVAGLALSLRPA